MTHQVTARGDALQAVWQAIVDQASVLAIVEAACDTHLEPPDPSHFMAVLRQTRLQLLEAADRLDRHMSPIEGATQTD